MTVPVLFDCRYLRIDENLSFLETVQQMLCDGTWSNSLSINSIPYHVVISLYAAAQQAGQVCSFSIWKWTKKHKSVLLPEQFGLYLPKPGIGHPANRHDGVDITSQAHNLCSDCSALLNDLISPCVGELRWCCIWIVGHTGFHVLKSCQTRRRSCRPDETIPSALRRLSMDQPRRTHLHDSPWLPSSQAVNMV
jgi:hypothetical protein